MKRTTLITLFLLIAAVGLFGQSPKGQFCHTHQNSTNDFGLWCPTINASFVPVKGTSYTTSITVLNGNLTPITGTLTFAPGPDVVLTVDDYDEFGNPICYDNNGNLTPCPTAASYDIVKWDIKIGTVHLVFNPAFESVIGGDSLPVDANGKGLKSNSGCGNGYSNSQKMDNGDQMYYLCGDNLYADNSGYIVLLIPHSYFIGKKPYIELSAQDSVTESDGSVVVWQSGLLSATAQSNGSTVAALDPPPPPKKGRGTVPKFVGKR
jgi:hypothetical protein